MEEPIPNLGIEEPKKNFFGPKFWYSLLAVFLVLAAGYGWKEYKFILHCESPTAEIKPECEEYYKQSITQTDSTETWKTYRNEEYGFEISYPNNWNVNVQDFHAKGFFISAGPDSAFIAILPNGEFDHGLEGKISEVEEELAGKKVSVTYVNGGIPIMYQFVDLSIPSNWKKCAVDLKNCHRIELGAVSSDDVFLLDEIISTFKFIDQIDTSTWKIYRNEEYGFEISLPSEWNADEIRNNGIVTFSSPETQRELESPPPCTECDGGVVPDLYFYFTLTPSGKDKDLGKEVIGNFTWDSYMNAGMDGYYHNYEISKDGRIYRFEVGNDKLEILKQALSTFKFTEEASIETITGVDADKDGIRDDVEEWIDLTYATSARTRLAARQAALALQRSLTATDVATATAISEEELASGYCLGYIGGGVWSYNVASAVTEIVLNTESRRAAYGRYANLFVPSDAAPPSREASKAFCTFDPDSETLPVASKYDAFTTCLKDSEAVFYGTFWCPHCQAQKKMFGSSAQYLPYVECSTPDGKAQTQICIDKKITAYPTWEFSDGSRSTGELSFEQLAEKTKCELIK